MTAFPSRKAGRPVRAGIADSLIVAVTLLTLTLPALAQTPTAKPAATPASPPPPVPSEPGVTTASYGDWMLRCQRLGPPEKPTRLCEVS